MNKRTTRRKFLKQLTVVSIVPSVLYSNTFIKKNEIHRIGFLSGAGVLQLEKVFTDELQKLGCRVGENIYGALPFALEIRKVNPQMPMVIATCPGMVSNGFAKSLEHPGGIYTGMDELPLGNNKATATVKGSCSSSNPYWFAFYNPRCWRP
ncbi:MAG TPA: hypothetical protein VK658_22120 [Chryseolinea sp.]|nr:hypothetical protein [Chryseolinea sp.]